MVVTVTPAISDQHPPIEVLIVGFGAVGIVYGYLLEKNGLARVTAVARSKYDSIIENGVNINSLRWGQAHGYRPHRLVRRLEDALSHRYDYVFLCTKSIPELQNSAEMLSPLLNNYIHAQPTYVLLQNGLGVEKALHTALEAKNGTSVIISAAVYIMANVLENGDVLHVNSDKVVLGIYKAPHSSLLASEKEKKSLDDLVDILNGSDFDASSVPNIAAAKFDKNLWNASIGMVSCLTRLTPNEWACDPKALESGYTIVRRMLTELIVVGRSMEYDETLLPSSLIDEKIEGEKKRTAESKKSGEFVTSALLDVRAGKPFELEVILGEAVRIGRENGCVIPTLEMAYGMLLPVQAKFLEMYTVSSTRSGRPT